MTQISNLTKPESGLPRWFVYICPHCGRQYRGPGGHRRLGDDAATGCFHQHVIQPRLIRVEVVAKEPLELAPLPPEQMPMVVDERDAAEWAEFMSDEEELIS